ncbi:MAG: hypothetical protein RLZZ292_786 [Bacteroidota bacterium]|jgi:geranylgeranyl reductase family protein
MYQFTTEVAIIGSGPAGCAASFFLAKENVPHLIFDKDVFPRDKICGDGLSPKVIHVMRKFDSQILEQMTADPEHFAPCWGGFAVAPNGDQLTIPISKTRYNDAIPPGFITRRYDFDYFLTKHIDTNHATVLHGAKVTALNRLEHGVEIEYSKDGQTQKAFAKTLIAADGDRSIVKKTFTPSKMDPKHYCAGIRAYYTNVKGMDTKKNLLEFHFINGILPGYFWIFPLADGTSANVGIGMISHYAGKYKVNLREALVNAIQNEPHLKERFADAKLEDKIVGWGLPLGSKIPTISGDRWILTGDAASLIDPISGEGIGNALYSGMLAGQAVAKAYAEKKDYTEAFLNEHYEKRVHRTMGPELRMSAFFQKISHYPKLLNFIIRRASRNKVFMASAADIFNDEFYKKLFNPIFAIRLFLGFFI